MIYLAILVVAVALAFDEVLAKGVEDFDAVETVSPSYPPNKNRIRDFISVVQRLKESQTEKRKHSLKRRV